MDNIQSLLKSYREERNRWITIRKEFRERNSNIDEENVEALKEFKKQDALIGGMISDMTFTIDWLNKGGHPDSRRGIQRRSVYQRTIVIDPYILQNMFKGYESRSASTVTEEQKWFIESALQKLTAMEREIFIMHVARCITAQDIGNMMGLQKSTIDTIIKRCKDKMRRDTLLLLI